ncbi:MAG: SDR family NAD(P)-dependent oxidoreductase [Pseudomonadota bacterium]
MTENTTALVTGASAGIGAAIARRLARDGYRLVLTARRRERLETLAAEIGTADTVAIIAADVGDTAAVTAALTDLPAPFGTPDVLVNNAGAALGLSAAHEADPGDWAQMIDTNCTALVNLTRAVLPGMVERGRGHVINMGSVAGTYPYRGSNVYGATKAFVEQFSLNLRADLLGTALRCTLIAPGMVGGSEFSLVRFKGAAERADAVYAGTRPLSPDDVAAAVAWALAQPAHVNVNRIELMPVCQAADSVGVVRDRD